MASARARKLALAADTFSGRVMAAPVGSRITPGADSYALVRAIASCMHKFTGRGISSASPGSANCRIPRRDAEHSRAGASAAQPSGN